MSKNGKSFLWQRRVVKPSEAQPLITTLAAI